MIGDASAKTLVSGLFSVCGSRGGRRWCQFHYFSLIRAQRRKPRNSVRCVRNGSAVRVQF